MVPFVIQASLCLRLDIGILRPAVHVPSVLLQEKQHRTTDLEDPDLQFVSMLTLTTWLAWWSLVNASSSALIDVRWISNWAQGMGKVRCM